VGVDHEWLATRGQLVDPKYGSLRQRPRVHIESAGAIVDDRGNGAVQIHKAFQHRAVDRSCGVIHDDPKPGVTAEVGADDPLSSVLPAPGPLDLRHRRIVPSEWGGAHPLLGKFVRPGSDGLLL